MPIFKTKEFCSLHHRPQKYYDGICIWNIHFRVQNNNQQALPAQTTKDDIREKSIPRSNVLVQKGSNTLCMLVIQKIHEETFCQLKTIDSNGRRIPLMLRLTSTYYAFGCKKYICKKYHLRNLYGCTAGTWVASKKEFFMDFLMLLEGDVIRCGLNSFNYYNK